jgi:hypothetical protein
LNEDGISENDKKDQTLLKKRKIISNSVSNEINQSPDKKFKRKTAEIKRCPHTN